MTSLRALPLAPLETSASRVTSLVGAQAPLAWMEVAPGAALDWSPLLCVLGPGAAAAADRLARVPARAQGLLAARLTGCRVAGRGLLLDGAGRILTSPHLQNLPPRAAADHDAFWWNWLSSDLPRPPGAVADRALSALADRPLPPCLLLAQPGDRVFGHWLMEILPRLALARRLGLGDLPLLLPRPLPSFAADCLALLGVPVSQALLYDHATEAPSPERLYLVSRPCFGTHCAPLAAALFDDIAAAASPPPAGAPRRLFLSRRGLPPSQRHLNRDDLLPLLTERGFVELRPQELPLPAQLGLLRQATHVVVEDGSAAHLMAAAGPGLAALVLAASDRPLALHRALAQARCHRLGFVLGEAGGGGGNHVDYRIDPADLRQALALLPGLS